MKRAFTLLAHVVFLCFFLSTSLYCLLTYIPFTYEQFLKAEVLRPLALFAHLHPWLYWATIACMAFAVKEDIRGRRVVRLLFAWFAALGVALLVHPLLTSLTSTGAALFWAIATLLPLLAWPLLLGIPWRAYGAEPLSPDPLPLFHAAWASALFVTAVYAVSGWSRLQNASEAMAAAPWSLAAHLTIFLGLFALAHWIRSAAGLFPRARLVALAAGHLLMAGLIFAGFRSSIGAAVTFTGPLADLYAGVFALSIASFLAGLRILLWRPVASWPHWITATLLAVVAAAAGSISAAVAQIDWNFLFQELTAAAVWVAVVALVNRMPTLPLGKTLRHGAVWGICIAAALGFRALQATPLRSASDPLLERYASFDPSFRLIRDVLQPAAPAKDADFYQFLAANTNLPRSVEVAPASVDLVEQLAPTGDPKPNIFVFNIDSLRQDYLGAYNPAVKFTPAWDQFARESTVFQNAFTSYGGTGLSEPAFWVGGMMLHKQYVQPFAPMNALEKLLRTDGYHTWVSRGTILDSILGRWPMVDELDRSHQNMDYDMCATLQEVEGRLNSGAPKDGPLFVYSQSQNIHISVIQREGAKPIGSGPYEGFYAPYASRIARIDTCFGGFMKFLKEKGLYDNSVIVLTADHGDSLGEEGRWGHAYTIFPEVLRIPLIVHLPQTQKPQLNYDTGALAFLMDITPSLYYLLGHRPIRQGEIFGRPLFTATAEEQKSYQKDSYMVASSYGAVYGVLSENGRRLYIADGANYRDYLFDLSSGAKAAELPSDEQASSREQIRQGIARINGFYHFIRK